jgi:outer membrane protein
LLAFCLCTFLSTTPAPAQQKRVLSLDELTRMALEKSPELHGAEQDVVSARSDLAQARAGRWAQLDVVGVVGPVQNADEPTVRVVQRDDRRVLTGRIVDNDKGIGIFGRLEFTLAQPLFTFGKISHRRDAAALGVDIQQSARLKKQGDVVLNIRELYYALVVALQGQGAAKDADDFIQDAGGRIRRLLELNSTNVDQSDLYRLDAFDAEIQQFKVKADSGARMAYLALKTAAGIPADQEFQLDATELSTVPYPLAPQEEYVRRALAQRPEILQVKKGVEAKEFMMKAARADLYPSVFAAAIGSFAGAPGRERFSNAYFRDEFNHAEVGVVLGTEWHFDFGIGRARVDKARAEYQKMIHTKEFAEQNIPLEVAKNYQDALEYQSSYEAYRKGSVASRRWIVSAFSNFDMGVGTARDIFDAIERYGRNQGEYLLALYNYHVAVARLNHSVGDYGISAP